MRDDPCWKAHGKANVGMSNIKGAKPPARLQGFSIALIGSRGESGPKAKPSSAASGNKVAVPHTAPPWVTWNGEGVILPAEQEWPVEKGGEY